MSLTTQKAKLDVKTLERMSIAQKMDGLSRTKQKELRRSQKRSQRSKWNITA